MKITRYLRWLTSGESFPNLRRSVIELNSYRELMKVFGLEGEPVLDRPDLDRFEYVEDVNERRRRDAEAIASVVRGANPRTIVEIGTSTGEGTVLLAANAPGARIFTVNIPPEEIEGGAGGVHTTVALERERIGMAYRQRGLPNIEQVYANTATWVPDVGQVDVAFIDGCHDSDFVFNDTIKMLRNAVPGTFLLWHDFNLGLVDNYPWIKSVCAGVERLFEAGHLQGRVFHVRDSWVGVYRVPGGD
jgi:hypothetical protein